MREKPFKFFLRQQVRITPKARPSGRDDVIRLKILEVPYRAYYKIPKGYRVAFLSIMWAAFIPYIIYQGIVRALKFEYKAKLRASLIDDEAKVLEKLENIKIR